LEEVASLCKEAIKYFQNHELWKYRYLAAFDFNVYVRSATLTVQTNGNGTFTPNYWL
jgi:hypothetical protein